jgi:hypothetical protein
MDSVCLFMREEVASFHSPLTITRGLKRTGKLLVIIVIGTLLVCGGDFFILVLLLCACCFF